MMDPQDFRQGLHLPGTPPNTHENTPLLPAQTVPSGGSVHVLSPAARQPR